MGSRDSARHTGLAGAVGEAAIFPARAAARAWRSQLETAADEMLSAPEIARILDRALAGPLPEELARSLVRHRVIERIAGELADTGELQRLLDEGLADRRLLELVDTVLASDAIERAVRSVASSPALREAAARQSVGLAEQVAARIRAATAHLDARVGRAARPGYGGVVSRGLALGVDALLAQAIVSVIGSFAALIASLVGGIRPTWLAGALLGVGWALVTAGYFVLFWSTVGQTPGMRLMRLRVRRGPTDAEPGLSAVRALVRTVGLALAIVPLFAGFLPALLDERRRALPDFMAGTVVVCDDDRSAGADASVDAGGDPGPDRRA